MRPGWSREDHERTKKLMKHFRNQLCKQAGMKDPQETLCFMTVNPELRKITDVVRKTPNVTGPLGFHRDQSSQFLIVYITLKHHTNGTAVCRYHKGNGGKTKRDWNPKQDPSNFWTIKNAEGYAVLLDDADLFHAMPEIDYNGPD